jgi:hypothetical protein
MRADRRAVVICIIIAALALVIVLSLGHGIVH